MISEKDRSKIIEIAKKYKVSKILLFGSNAISEEEGQDIDLAVEGIQASQFFKFYSELIFELSKPVDLIDLNINSRFNQMVAEEGIPIYG